MVEGEKPYERARNGRGDSSVNAGPILIRNLKQTRILLHLEVD